MCSGCGSRDFPVYASTARWCTPGYNSVLTGNMYPTLLSCEFTVCSDDPSATVTPFFDSGVGEFDIEPGDELTVSAHADVRFLSRSGPV